LGTDVGDVHHGRPAGADGAPTRRRHGRFTTAAKPAATPTATPTATPHVTPVPTPKPTPGRRREAHPPTPEPTPNRRRSPRHRPRAQQLGGGRGRGPRRSGTTQPDELPRGGGLVTATGACSSPGGSGIRRSCLTPDPATPSPARYAKLLATTAVCSHFDGGNPGSTPRAGYRATAGGRTWARIRAQRHRVGLGTQRTSSRAFVEPARRHLGQHDERPTRGRDRRRVSGGQIRIVIDFYHP